MDKPPSILDGSWTPPPVKRYATWSVSMYDPQGYYVPNAINRYNLAKLGPPQPPTEIVEMEKRLIERAEKLRAQRARGN